MNRPTGCVHSSHVHIYIYIYIIHVPTPNPPIPILDSAHMYVYHASKGPITCINLGSKTSEAGGEWEDREGNKESGLYINQCAEQLAISKRQIGHSHERGKLCL
jgi:hypothetical protein